MPLVFASGAFVPTASMAGWLQPFAEHPAGVRGGRGVRSLVLGGPWVEDVLISLAWGAGIVLLRDAPDPDVPARLARPAARAAGRSTR